jgi:hypothetical protein
MCKWIRKSRSIIWTGNSQLRKLRMRVKKKRRSRRKLKNRRMREKYLLTLLNRVKSLLKKSKKLRLHQLRKLIMKILALGLKINFNHQKSLRKSVKMINLFKNLSHSTQDI